jgi:2-hydroxychromene-2-carboxylate isomerase
VSAFLLFVVAVVVVVLIKKNEQNKKINFFFLYKFPITYAASQVELTPLTQMNQILLSNVCWRPTILPNAILIAFL